MTPQPAPEQLTVSDLPAAGETREERERRQLALYDREHPTERLRQLEMAREAEAATEALRRRCAQLALPLE